MTKIDKNAIGASLAFAGMAIILVAVFVGGFWTKNAPALREWLIRWSYKASDFASWLDSPQFWIGVCLTLLCVIVGVFALLNKDEF